MGHRFRRLHRLQQQVVRITRRLFSICFVCGTFEEEYRTEVVPVRRILTSNKPLCGVSFLSPECDHRRMTCSELREDQRLPRECAVEAINLDSAGESDRDPSDFNNDAYSRTHSARNDPTHGKCQSPLQGYRTVHHFDAENAWKNRELEVSPPETSFNSTTNMELPDILDGSGCERSTCTSQRDLNPVHDQLSGHGLGQEPGFRSGCIVEPLNLAKDMSDSNSDTDLPQISNMEHSQIKKESLIQDDHRTIVRNPSLENTTVKCRNIRVTPANSDVNIHSVKLSDSENTVCTSIGNFNSESVFMMPLINVRNSSSSPTTLEAPVVQGKIRNADENYDNLSSSRKLDLSSSTEKLPPTQQIMDGHFCEYPQGWTVEQTLSRGKFGYVEIVSNDSNDQRYVLKTLDSSKGEREFSIFSECQGRFVSELCSSVIRNSERLMFLKFYELGDLNQWLDKDKLRDRFDERIALWITANIYSAVKFLHKQGVLHLDIKPSNILIDDCGYPVLSDFGSARRITECQRSRYNYAMTPAYKSPEILNGSRADKMADLWATACCFYEIAKGHSPFLGHNTAETELKISLGVNPDVSGLSLAACSFLATELNLSAEHRSGFHLGAVGVMAHELFFGIDWNSINRESHQKPSPLLRVLAGLDRSALSVIKRRWPSFESSSSSDLDLMKKAETPKKRNRRKRKRRCDTIKKTNRRCNDGYLGDSEEMIDLLR